MAQTALGIGLLVLALVLWELRNIAPAWIAKSMTTSARFTTLSETDNARITRAFEAVRQTMWADAILEAEPDEGQTRHTVLTVVAPTSSEAVDTVTRMAAAMDKAFSRHARHRMRVHVG